MTTGERLGQWLDDNGISRGKLARDHGLHRSAVTRYISGVRVPALRAAAAIELATGGAVKAVSWVDLSEE